MAIIHHKFQKVPSLPSIFILDEYSVNYRIIRVELSSCEAVSFKIVYNFFEVKIVASFSPLEMNHGLFVSIDAQSYLDGQIFLKSVLFDFVTVTVEDRDLNK